ncbi:MAG: TolC family protein [Bryobacteraceae bacterium]|nr:TolC family protein [Bryobacteraceae bacterium]
MKNVFLLAVIGVLPDSAQMPPPDPLSLKDAVRMAMDKNPSLAAAFAAGQAAESRIAQARAGHLPKVNYAESWSRSDNPVSVFSSLLTQRRFGASNFQIESLNRPGFLNNFQSQVTADQTLYDAGQAKHAMRAAELQKGLTREDGRRMQMEVTATVVRAYYDALLSMEQLKATAQAMRSAQADLERAQAIRAAGMSTEVDGLSIRVHLSMLREQQIRREADLEVARAALNDALGLPLDTAHELTASLATMATAPRKLTDHERSALDERPEARQVKLAISLAQNQAAAARSSLLPQIGLRAAFEADRQRLYDRGGINWLVSVGLRWNLFNGFGDQARRDESKFALRRSEAEAAQAGSAIRMQVRRAFADLRAAQQRIEVAGASVDEATESLRITQDRYAAGLSSVTDLLRTETAVLEARTRHLGAIHDSRIAAIMLELAAGTLSVDSEALNEGARP